MVLQSSELGICAEVTPCTIREYSAKGLLGPVMRSASSSYRSYDPLLLPQFYLLRLLRNLGCTPQEIQEYGESRTPEKTLELFGGHSARLRDEIAVLQAQLDVLESRAALIGEGLSANPGEIRLCALPEQHVRFSALETHSERKKEMEAFRRSHWDIRLNGNAACPLGYAYSDFAGLIVRPDLPSHFVSYDPQGPDALPAGEYLIGTVPCFYGEKTGLPQRMYRYAMENDLESCGPAYTVHLLDTACVTGAARYLMRIAVGVKRGE
jgi:DNA-binding transcriptional MerR regulator